MTVSDVADILREVKVEVARDPGITSRFRFVEQVVLRTVARAQAAGLTLSVRDLRRNLKVSQACAKRILDSLANVVTGCNAAGFEPTELLLLEGIETGSIHAPNGDAITIELNPGHFADPDSEEAVLGRYDDIPFVDGDAWVRTEGTTVPMLEGPGTSIIWYRIGDAYLCTASDPEGEDDPEDPNDEGYFASGLSADVVVGAVVEEITLLVSWGSAVSWNVNGLDIGHRGQVVDALWDRFVADSAFADVPRSVGFLSGYLFLMNDDCWRDREKLLADCAIEFADRAGGIDDASTLVNDIWDGSGCDTPLEHAIRDALVAKIAAAGP